MKNYLNIQLEALLQEVKNQDKNYLSIYLKGSNRIPDTTDLWSDIDLLIVTNSGNIKSEYTKILDCYFEPIQAKQIYEYEECLIYRVVSAKANEMMLFDIQIVDMNFWEKYQLELGKEMQLLVGEELLGKPRKSDDDQTDFSMKYDEVSINNIWFIFYESVKKVARQDNLIGLHLVFDLIREYLVLLMVERDMGLATNIHRYGENEKLPKEMDLKLLQTNSKIDKLLFIERLAELYDCKLMKMFEEYDTRINVFKKHIEKSVNELGGSYRTN